MRGTRGILSRGSPTHGIIPAYAGNTLLELLVRVSDADHPRVCGEHSGGLTAFLRLRGSSPRMRGTHGCENRTNRETGIIPAYAGNTRAVHVPIPVFRDHPRVCGEHWREQYKLSPLLGSSPRMRGTPEYGLVV